MLMIGFVKMNEKGEMDTQEFNEYLMYIETNRTASFKDWPFQEGCTCTPQKMAEAGFFHIPSEQEPDAVRCFACGKELDGWEPNDDPWQEHASHSSKCPYLKYRHQKLTVEGLMKLIKSKYLLIMKSNLSILEEFDTFAKDAKAQMEQML